MKYSLRRGDCLELLEKADAVKCIFADPFDNIGLGYDTYKDRMPDDDYVDFLAKLVNLCVQKAEITWISFNERWTDEMGMIFYDLKRESRGHKRHLLTKHSVQVFTFGQHNKRDLGNNHRPLWRIMWNDAKLYPNAIKVPSWRQRNGDKRAAPGGRVPGDVFDMQYPPSGDIDLWAGRLADHLAADAGAEFDTTKEIILKTVQQGEVHPGDALDFPRVTGNSKQRCDWHPTQLHEELVERCIKLSTVEGDGVIDPFGGTGTTMRVCKRLNRSCTLFEMDDTYCRKIAEMNGLKVLRTPGGWGAAA